MVLGSLVCEGVGPICLGTKSVTLKRKRKKSDWEKKQREEKRERKTHLPRFHQQVDLLHLWFDRAEIWRRGSKLK